MDSTKPAVDLAEAERWLAPNLGYDPKATDSTGGSEAA